MRSAGWALSVILVYPLLHICGALAQSPDNGKSASAENASANEPEKRILRFGNADELTLATTLEYYAPEPGFDGLNRDIDLQLARIALGAHETFGWEFMFDAFLLRAHGTRTEASLAPNPPQVTSNVLALGAGPMVRWNFLQFKETRLFLNMDGSLFAGDRPFPQHGSVYDFFLRAGGGIAFKVSNSYWIESGFNFAHISNGQGFGAQNPTWQGRGLSVGVRRVFNRKPEKSQQHSFGIFRKADEKAWITTAEYFAPLPGIAHRNNLQGDLRALRINRAWHFANGFEFQLGSTVQKTDKAAGFGPLLRWNFAEKRSWRLFAEGSGEFLQTGSPAWIIPWTGDGYTALIQAGGGSSFQLHQSYWLELGFNWVHIPDGFGSGATFYPRWSGQGVFVGLRHRSHRSSE